MPPLTVFHRRPPWRADDTICESRDRLTDILVSMGVFVIGMHRSGTSALTRLIADLGLFVGNPEQLMPASKDNETGYYEVLSLSDHNESLLSSLGGQAMAPPDMGDGWVDRLSDRVAKSIEIFNGVLRNSSWVWKDPRNCLLLPYWRELFQEKHVAVAIFRHPTEVAASLVRRDITVPLGMSSSAAAVALWEFYVRASLEAMTSMPVLCTTYDSLLSHPDQLYADLGSFFETYDIEFDPIASPLGISAELRHHEGQSNSDLTVEQLGLVRIVNGLVGVHDSFVPPDLEPMAPSSRRLMSERRASARSIAKLVGELTHRRQVIDDMTVELDHRQHLLDDMAVELDHRRQLVDDLAGQLERASAEAARWRGSVDRLATECDRRDSRAEELEGDLEAAYARIHIRAQPKCGC